MKKFFNRRRQEVKEEKWTVYERETNYKHFEGSPSECIRYIGRDYFNECYLVNANGQIVEDF